MKTNKLEYCRKLLSTALLIFVATYAQAQVGSWKSVDEAATWLNANMGNIKQDDKTFNQEAKIDQNNHNYLKLTVKETDPKGTTIGSYEFYLGHLDAGRTKFEVKGTQINILLYTKDDLRVVKQKAGESFKGYQNDLIIRCDDPQLAKDMVAAINYLIGESSKPSPAFDSQTEAINWLTKNIKDIDVTGEKVEQKFQFFPDQRNKLVLNVTEVSAKGKVAWEYTFYANDFAGSSGKMSVSGEKLAIKFTTADNQMMVKVFKDGVQQKFNKYFELFSNDAKAAIDILSTFQVAFGGASATPNQAASATTQTTSAKENAVAASHTSTSTTPGLIITKTTQKDIVSEKSIPEPEYTARPYYFDDGKLKDMERADATFDFKVKGMGYGGSSYYYTAFGAKSTVTFSKNALPKMYIKLETNADPSELLVVVKESADGKKSDRRRFEQGSMGMAGKARDVSDNEVNFSIKKVRTNLYEIIFDQGLPPGQYAIMPVSDSNTNALAVGSTKTKITCFGVE